MASPLRKERNGTDGLHQNATPSNKNSLDSGQDQPQQDIQNVVDIRTVRVSSIGFLEKTWKEGRKKERPVYTDSREEFLWVTGTPGALLCSVGHRPFRVAPEGQRILFSELFLWSTHSRLITFVSSFFGSSQGAKHRTKQSYRDLR